MDEHRQNVSWRVGTGNQISILLAHISVEYLVEGERVTMFRSSELEAGTIVIL